MQNNLVPFIEFHGAGKQYDGKYAVRDLDLTIYQGEFFVLVGGSGSGKSTTLRMINALIEPTDGNVYLQANGLKTTTSANFATKLVTYCSKSRFFPR